MSVERGFYFQGGVTQFGEGKSVKFLCFLLNGSKEISLSEAKKLGFVLRNDGPGTRNGDVRLEEAITMYSQAVVYCRNGLAIRAESRRAGREESLQARGSQGARSDQRTGKPSLPLK
jgi:hypothetical protein